MLREDGHDRGNHKIVHFGEATVYKINMILEFPIFKPYLFFKYFPIFWERNRVNNFLWPRQTECRVTAHSWDYKRQICTCAIYWLKHLVIGINRDSNIPSNQNFIISKYLVFDFVTWNEIMQGSRKRVPSVALYEQIAIQIGHIFYQEKIITISRVLIFCAGL